MPPRSALAPRRRTGGSVWQKRAEKAQTSLKNLRKKTRESEVPQALMAGASTLAGAATCAAVKGTIADADGNLMGIPADAILALTLGTAGVTMKMPWLIHFAAGAAAPYVADMVEGALFEAQVQADAAAAAAV